MKKQIFVTVGRVIKAHGIHGEIKIDPLSNVHGRFDFLHEVNIELKSGEFLFFNVEYSSIRNDIVILKLHGIDDRDEAEKLRGSFVSVSGEDVAPLDNGSYYIFDIEGLDVYDINNEKIGIVKRIEQYPANDVIVVEKDTEVVMVPATKEFVSKVDLKARKLIINLRDDLPSYPKGM